jgi:hypothetical protein
MTLPIDFITSLWMQEVPVWELEAQPCAADGADSASSAPADAAQEEASAFPPAAPFQPTLLFDPPDEVPAGYRLVFKGFKMSGRVMVLPFDTLLARPWVRADTTCEPKHHRRHPADEVVPERPVPDPDATRKT